MEKDQENKPRRDLKQLQPWPEGMKRFEDASYVEPFRSIKLPRPIANISYTGNSSFQAVQSPMAGISAPGSKKALISTIL